MKSTTVYWTPYIQNLACEWANILFEEPESLLSYISKGGVTSKSLQYLRCPAFLDSCKNAFVIKSPIDLVVSIDRQNGLVSTDRFDQSFYDEFINNRGADDGLPYLVTLPPRYLMFSQSSVDIEVLPLMAISSESTQNFDVIPGRFDIGKWMRPIDLTVAIKDDKKPINLKQGDPLFVVRFTCLDRGKIEFERVIVDEPIRSAVSACVGIKNIRQKLSLESLYELSNKFMKLIKKGF
jgi:hypothetical protein